MPTMHHPALENVEVDVPAGDVSQWREQGWKAPGVPDEPSKSKSKKD